MCRSYNDATISTAATILMTIERKKIGGMIHN
jgi:hypothetical protein